MVKGYANKILKVDLTSGAISVEEPPAQLLPPLSGRQRLRRATICSKKCPRAPTRWVPTMC